MSDALKDKRILVIDDEQAMINIVSSILKRMGAQSYGVNSPERAFHMMKSQDFDAIILDRYMQERDGLEVLKEIKDTPVLKDVPVIMLTGDKSAEGIKSAIDLGPSGYIIKPFTPKSFLLQLEKLLDKRVFLG